MKESTKGEILFGFLFIAIPYILIFFLGYEQALNYAGLFLILIFGIGIAIFSIFKDPEERKKTHLVDNKVENKGASSEWHKNGLNWIKVGIGAFVGDLIFNYFGAGPSPFLVLIYIVMFIGGIIMLIYSYIKK